MEIPNCTIQSLTKTSILLLSLLGKQMSWSQDSTDFSTQTQQGQAVKAKPGYQDGALKHPQYYTALTPFRCLHGNVKKCSWPGWRDGSAVRALVSAAENPGLIPSTHMVVHNHS